MQDSFLDDGFILDKRIGVGQPKRIEDAKILVANTAMDTDKVKIYGARVRVDSMAKASAQLLVIVSDKHTGIFTLHVCVCAAVRTRASACVFVCDCCCCCMCGREVEQIWGEEQR